MVNKEVSVLKRVFCLLLFLTAVVSFFSDAHASACFSYFSGYMPASVTTFKSPTEASILEAMNTLGVDQTLQLKIMNQTGIRSYKDDAQKADFVLDVLKSRPLTKKILDELGYEKQTDSEGKPRLVFKSRPAKVFAVLNRHLAEQAKLAGLKADEVVYLGFLVKPPSGPAVRVRPGIDSIPAGSQRLAMSQISNKDFYEMWADGIFVLEATDIFPHDLGHVFDLIDRPLYMKAYRRFARAQLKRINSAKSFANYLKDGNTAVPEFEKVPDYMDMILNEFLWTARTENMSLIQKLVPGMTSDLVSLTDLRAKYRKLGTLELLSRSEALAKNHFHLFAYHGGGSRDFYYFFYYLKYKTALNPNLTSGTVQYFAEEAPGIFERLDVLTQPTENLNRAAIDSVRDVVKEFARRTNRPNDFEGAHRELLVRELALLEFRLRNLIHYDFSPEQAANDIATIFETGSAEAYRHSPTFRFFERYEKGSVARARFVDPFVKPTP